MSPTKGLERHAAGIPSNTLASGRSLSLKGGAGGSEGSGVRSPGGRGAGGWREGLEPDLSPYGVRGAAGYTRAAPLPVEWGSFAQVPSTAWSVDLAPENSSGIDISLHCRRDLLAKLAIY